MKKIVFVLFVLLPVLSFGQATGCPHITGSNDTTTCGTSSVTLTASCLETGATTAYTVTSIPFAPPYPVNAGTVFSLGTDDIWSSSPITLPFNFCFFGSSYNQLWVGSNGVMTFTDPGSTYCPWSFTAAVPSSSLIMNAIFGVYQDIDPSVCGTIRYDILGSYPCRTFVFNFDGVCHFSCTSIQTTSQIVLYEGTNVVDIYIYNKPLCSSWNSGNSLVGIQNATGTIGYTPPGRNTGQWTATNEAWRFIPSGAPNYTISWFSGGSILGYGNSVTVAPTITTDYIALVTYDNCDGTQYIDMDTIRVNIGVSDIQVTASDTTICYGESTTLDATGATIYSWNNGMSGNSINVSPASNTTYIVTGTDATGCEDIDTIDIFVNPLPIVNLAATPSDICVGDESVLIANGANSYVWNPALSTSDSLFDSPTATTSYSVTGTDANGCSNTASTTVTVNPTPTIDITAIPQNGCEPLNVNFSVSVAPAASSYNWSFGDGTTSGSASPHHTYGSAGNYDVSLGVVSVDGCENADTLLGFIEVYPLPTAGFMADETSVTMDDPLVDFADLSNGATMFFWNFGDFGSPSNYSGLANPSHSYSGPGDYIVWQTVETEHGCRDSAFVIIHVDLNIAFYVPNAFTPYFPDGINDEFRPYGIGVALEDGDFSMRIFDRWGHQIFESNDMDFGWDGSINGELVMPGTYSYIIDVKYGDGLVHVFSGVVSLIQ
ncbi:MAG: gliding motility-associated C-terminal domain-containing protein [Bacteroidales bacterium]|nr:gliding motility-associated C-terminal domain-containing protein [Bacteroidales bacterium]